MKLDLSTLGFKTIENPDRITPGCVYLAKRQTLNTNRAICVIQLDTLPDDMESFLKRIRKKVAFQVGFFPYFWGLGLQVVLVSPGATRLTAHISNFVAKIDNQWAIIQSVFFVDPIKAEFISARTWGQIVTGKFQDEITRQLSTCYRNIST
jgi:hypothetical protein